MKNIKFNTWADPRNQTRSDTRGKVQNEVSRKLWGQTTDMYEIHEHVWNLTQNQAWNQTLGNILDQLQVQTWDHVWGVIGDKSQT